MDGLTEGRIVHYVLSTKVHRAAIVVHVNDAGGSINLMAFCDPRNDGSGPMYIERAKYSESKEPGTWHWIERA